ncbi:MAG: zf-HC2 domain-containing protein [Phycisphaerales bacterium]|nr:MAG: zf-HC2 domain-containing protein [Phycisphaerales bacterium]
MNGPCPEMQERIIDYVLGALDELQTEAVHEHLDGCAHCRQYLQTLDRQHRALAALGDEVQAGMAARREQAIDAFHAVAPEQEPAPGARPWASRLAPLAVAALVVLGVGIVIGRLTAPKPVDVEQLRAELQSSIAASLQQAVHASVLAEMNQRLEFAVAAGEARIRVDVVNEMRRDLHQFATDVVSNSEAMMDQRLAELVQLIEAARLKDRQRVVQAFEQVELNRRRDRTQFGRGLKSLVALTSASPTPTNN